jgi:uncharacterized protein (TIGR00255 family)
MTGYGRGEAQSKTVTIVVELKSVNNRFRDIQLRVPREYMVLEPRLNTMLKGPFQRGRIDVFVRRTTVGSRTQVTADVSLANDYADVINELTAGMVGFVEREIPFSFILGQPGVLSTMELPVDVMSEGDVVETAMESAIADLLQMREAEGKALGADLKDNLNEVFQLIAEVDAQVSGINDRLRARLESRIGRMIGDRFDPYRIVQEVALLVDKADVSEELTRLRSHCDQFMAGIDEGAVVGRRLDFLLQEMNREVNTIGSKASEHQVSHRVVHLKSVLERMREQATNIE